MRRNPELANTVVFSCPSRCLDDSGLNHGHTHKGFSLPGEATVRSAKRGPSGAWGVPSPNTPFFLPEKKPSVFGFFLPLRFDRGGSR